MSTVKAYYDGITFFPIEALSIPKGKVVSLTIDEEEVLAPEIARKLAQLAYINRNLEKLSMRLSRFPRNLMKYYPNESVSEGYWICECFCT